MKLRESHNHVTILSSDDDDDDYIHEVSNLDHDSYEEAVAMEEDTSSQPTAPLVVVKSYIPFPEDPSIDIGKDMFIFNKWWTLRRANIESVVENADEIIRLEDQIRQIAEVTNVGDLLNCKELESRFVQGAINKLLTEREKGKSQSLVEDGLDEDEKKNMLDKLDSEQAASFREKYNSGHFALYINHSSIASPRYMLAVMRCMLFRPSPPNCSIIE